jgi:hypothetical protein
MTASFYIDTVSVKEIEGGELDVNGNIGAGGIITGNNLTPNFVPAMFGIHWNAAAEIEYTGGLPSTITWECTGKETVTQTITYNGSDQPTSVVTQGATSGRTATETLTWSGDDLTGYSVAFS